MKHIKKPEMTSMRRKLIREIVDAKVRFIAITIVVVIGVTVFIASSMAYRNLDTSYKYTYEKLNFADFRVKADAIPQYVAGEAEKVPGVELATPRVKTDESFMLSTGKRLFGRVTGLPYQRPIVDDLEMKEGRYFEEGDSQVCIAESHFAKFYDLHPGDTMIYTKNGRDVPIEIIGVAGSPEYLVLAGEKGDIFPMMSATTMAVLWMPIEEVQLMAGLPGRYNEILFKVDDPADMNLQIAGVEEVMKNTGIRDVITQEDHLGNQLMQMDLEGFRSFALFFPVLFLGIACFSIYILLSRLVYTQRPFIGVMRALGYTKRQILFHYLSFALVIGVLGAFVGAVCGFAVSSFLTSVYAGTMGIPLVKIEIFWSVLLQGMFLSILFCAFAGIMPALRSARLDPSKAMRGEMLEKAFRRPLLEKVVPFLSGVPMFLKVPFRNMFRNRRRTAFTILGLIFSVMMVLMFLAVLNTADSAINRGFHLNNQFDMVALFLSGQSDALVGKISRLPGVESVEPMMGNTCKVSWNGDSTDTTIMGVKTDTEMKRFYTADQEQVELTERHVLMNQWFNLEKGLQVGDRVTVSTDIRDRDFIIGDFIEEPMGNLIYVPRDEAMQLFGYGLTSRGGYYIKTFPGKQSQVSASLQDIPGMAATIELTEIKHEIDHYMSLLYVIVYVMLVFALIMAFTLTLNTITINILEREKELATIRTIGTESWKISAMTTLENVILGLVSIVPGIILGLAVGQYAMGLQQTDYFTLTLDVQGSSYILVTVGILVILMLCQIPSLRYVKKLKLAEATKERGG